LAGGGGAPSFAIGTFEVRTWSNKGVTSYGADQSNLTGTLAPSVNSFLFSTSAGGNTQLELIPGTYSGFTVTSEQRVMVNGTEYLTITVTLNGTPVTFTLSGLTYFAGGDPLDLDGQVGQTISPTWSI
jgi:hypothetical protein